MPSCKPKPAPAAAVADVPSGTVTVDPGLLDSGRIEIGVVERRLPRWELRLAAEVRSSESGVAEVGALVPGRVASLEVGEGARVKRGQVLAWIDAPDVARATADVLRARAHRTLVARRLARQRELDESGATSKSALEDALAEDAAARIDLAAARTLLTSLGGQEPPLDPDGRATVVPARAPVRSPIDGVVASHDAVLGGSVAPDRTLFRIVAGTSLVVLARLPETASIPVAGAHVTVRARDDRTVVCDGAVRGDVQSVDEATRTLGLRIQPAAGCTGLVAGGYVDVLVPLAAAVDGPAALVVPREAVVEVRGVPCVFTATDKAGSYRAAPVRLGPSDGHDAVIEAGVGEGHSVVVRGALLLKGELLRAGLGGV